MQYILYDGLYITLSTLAITIVFDFLSLNYILKLIKTPEGKDLYLKSIMMNILNNIILGTLAFVTFVYFFENKEEKIFFYGFIDFLLLLFIQSLGYYFAHILMHTKKLYFIHKFHHKYSEIVIPMSANSVSFLEYIFAYLSPFIIGIILVKPNRVPLKCAIHLVSFSNILIHTPWLSSISKRLLPNFLVKTYDHLEHHLKSNKNFSAPIINWDNLICLKED